MEGEACKIYGQQYNSGNFCSNEECIPNSVGSDEVNIKYENDEVKCEDVSVDEWVPSLSEPLAPIVVINVDECQTKEEDSQDISYSIGPLQDPLAFHDIDIWDDGKDEYGAYSGIGCLDEDPGRHHMAAGAPSISDSVLSTFFKEKKITLASQICSGWNLDHKTAALSENLHKIDRSRFKCVNIIDNPPNDFRCCSINNRANNEGGRIIMNVNKNTGVNKNGNECILSNVKQKDLSNGDAAYETVCIAAGQVDDDNLLKSNKLSKASGHLKSKKCKRKRTFTCSRVKRKRFTLGNIDASVITPRDYSILSDQSICINIPENLDDIIMRYSTKDISQSDTASQSHGKLYNLRERMTAPVCH